MPIFQQIVLDIGSLYQEFMDILDAHGDRLAEANSCGGSIEQVREDYYRATGEIIEQLGVLNLAVQVYLPERFVIPYIVLHGDECVIKSRQVLKGTVEL